MAKKYYWLKLKRDFFKRHDIRIIEDMDNGKDYILLYLKLLVESIDHNGELRFSDTIPYSDKMISTITNTNIDIVRSAMKVFQELKFIEVMDDETIFMSQVNDMIGSESEWAQKKRLYRDNKQKELGQCPGQNEDMSDKSKIKSIEIEKDQEKEHKKVVDEAEIVFNEGQLKLQQQLCKAFGVSEMNQPQNYFLIENMIRLQISKGNYDWFKSQVFYYFTYKNMTKEKKHGFKVFMGELSEPDKGAWNAENWKKKCEEEKAKEHVQPAGNVQPTTKTRIGRSSTLKEINQKR